MTSRDIDSLLLDEVIQFRASTTNNEKFISISNQIQLKLLYTDKNKLKNISSDIKQCISYHFKSLEENEIHYDQINLNIIFDYIELVNDHEKILLTQYLIRIIKKYGYEEQVDFCSQKLNTYERAYLKTHKGISSSLKKFHLFCTSNILNSCLVLMLIYLGYSIILLPAYYDCMGIFEISYVPICKNFHINHWCNTIGGMFGLFEDFSIIPKNIFALILMIIAKIVFIVFIVNIILNQITKTINK